MTGSTPRGYPLKAERLEFVKQYVLNRALARPHGMEAVQSVRSAKKAWEEIHKED